VVSFAERTPPLNRPFLKALGATNRHFSPIASIRVILFNDNSLVLFSAILAGRGFAAVMFIPRLLSPMIY
jgi:hypothetical protein